MLVCNDARTANAEKLRHTAEWGVPAVSADWLWISVQTGQKKPFEPYLIHAKPSQSTRIDEKPSLRPHVEARDRESVWRRTSISPEKHGSMPPPTNDTSAATSPHKPTDDDKDGKQEPDKPDAPSLKKPLSRSSSKVLESAINSFLKQARESNNNQNNTSGESPTKNNNNGPQWKRSVLGRALSGASTTSTMTNLTTGAGVPRGAFSRTSSIDTLNEDGYGSTIDESTSIQHDPSTKTSRNNSFLSTTGKPTTGGGGGGYIDSPVLEDEEPPPTTQLNYEDPESTRMREKIMRRAAMKAARNNAADDQQQQEQQQQQQQQQQPSMTSTTTTKQAVIMDEFDVDGHRRATRRSRRFTEKEKEKEKDREGKRMPFWDDDSE